MRRLLFCLLLLFAAAAQSPLSAQSGLNISPLFDGDIIPQERMVETRVRGKSIEKYRLTYYRSLRMDISDEENAQIMALIDKDKEQCHYHSAYRKNPHSAKTYTCKLQLAKSGDKNRFLCYQSMSKKDIYEVTVIYMEGTVGSLEELEELLK